MRATGYSIWLMPTGLAYDELAAAIVAICERHGTPRFAPHVTLIGQVQGEESEILAETAVLAYHLRPFDITLGPLTSSDRYFRAVVAEVEPTSAVMAANAAAREAFGRDGDPPYEPHLSLAYGVLSEVLLEDARAAYDRIINRQFTVGSLHLVRTEGEVAAWYEVAELDFGHWT